MSMWDGNELERRTATRVALAGFAPALNVTHADTNSEFDVYAFLPQPSSLARLMAQCTVSHPTHERISALKANADTFGAQHSLFVTAGIPHSAQVSLAATHGVALASEHANSTLPPVVIAGRQINAQAIPSTRERFITESLRCLSRLRRIARDNNGVSAAAGELLEVWNRLHGVSLITDPFDRLSELYDIHYAAPDLAERCALAENLANTGPCALKKAYTSGAGTYTQSALAAQTLNRTHTLVAFCECACLVALGESVPTELDHASGRRGPLVRWLAKQPERHMLGIAAFEFMYGWGGLWSFQGTEIAAYMARDLGVARAELDKMRGCVDNLLRRQNMGSFIKPISFYDLAWESMALLPHYAKGIGLRRLEAETSQTFNTPTCNAWKAWKAASTTLSTDCRSYEQAH